MSKTLAELLASDPWGRPKPDQTPLAKILADPSLGFTGAVDTYLSRLKRMQAGPAQDMLDTAADPNAEGIQRAANLLGGLGLKVLNVPAALMPSSQELRDRAYQAGASPEVQALGGALGDAVNIPDPATVGPALATLVKAGATAKAVAAGAAPLLKSAAVAPLGKAMEQAAQDGIIAYHGSPHSFDRFDMSKIGTGEGAQAYGHGLYFAQNEGVAEQYRKMLADRLQDTPILDKHTASKLDDIGETADDVLHRISMNLENAIIDQRGPPTWDDIKHDISSRYQGRQAAQEADQVIKHLEDAGWPSKFNQKNGAMYQVKLDVQPHELLDWDKPLSEQPKALQDVFRSASPRMQNDYVWGKSSLGEAYGELAGSSGGREAANEKLKALGIKGVKYLDQGSRDAGKGSYNYAIFDDKLITILKKYGIPMTAGAGGAMLVAGQHMPPDIAAQLQQQ